MDEMNFDDLTPVEIPVRHSGKRYVLREATGDASSIYQNAVVKSAKLGADGKPVGFENVADTEPLLVSLCLYSLDGEGRIRLDNDGNPDPRYRVPLKTVRGWPAKMIKQLYEKAVNISNLRPQQETVETLEEKMAELRTRQEKLVEAEDAKKLHNGSTVGSGSPAA